jgi:DNA-binding transcriptional regulator YiaG
MKARATGRRRSRRANRGNRPAPNWKAILTQLREDFNLSREILATALRVSDTTLAKWEKGTSPPAAGSLASIKRLENIVAGLSRVMKKGFIPTWLTSPNDACERKTPLDLLAKGDYESVQDLIYFLEAGEPV